MLITIKKKQKLLENKKNIRKKKNWISSKRYNSGIFLMKREKKNK